jgi:hypothetical protein
MPHSFLRTAAKILICLVLAAGLSPALAQVTPPLDPRCAYVDLGDWLYAQPHMQCFDLEMKCAQEQKLGCFKRDLAFEDGYIRAPGQPDKRRTAQPFGFIDAGGKHWDVPVGYETDGASIPATFKPVIGGSWTKGYVRAAVLHDFYIRRRTSDAKAVHQLFFDALLVSGVSYYHALLMYLAVNTFGPDWKSIDLAAFENARQAELAEIRRKSAEYEAEYRACLEQKLNELASPSAEQAWALCPLDGKHQFILDLMSTAADEITKAAPSILQDFNEGRCIEEAPDKFVCP